MNRRQSPIWERIIAWLVVAAIGLRILAGTLPRLLPALVVLTITFVVVRLICFYTQL